MANGWVKRNPWIFVVAPLAIVLFAWGFGEVVMHLWNWLTPTLFGWHTINFWQALGLVILCRILFGGFGGHGNDRRSRLRAKFYDRAWERMTPEEREKFLQKRGERWCGAGSPPNERSEPA